MKAVRNNIPKILYDIPVEYLSTHFALEYYGIGSCVRSPNVDGDGDDDGGGWWIHRCEISIENKMNIHILHENVRMLGYAYTCQAKQKNQKCDDTK